MAIILHHPTNHTQICFLINPSVVQGDSSILVTRLSDSEGSRIRRTIHPDINTATTTILNEARDLVEVDGYTF